jgi:hypothetical protein
MPETWEEEYLRSTVCFFPKHRDESWYAVLQDDRNYVIWLLDTKELEDDLTDALRWGVQHVPDRI